MPLFTNVATVLSRREFLRRLGWANFWTFIAINLAGSLRFFLPRALNEPPMRISLGKPETFPAGNVFTEFKERNGFWLVRRLDGKFYCLRATCTHLGCIPNWLESQNKFKCPCHGSGFKSDGVNFEGPAPRPLDRYKVYVASDGELWVDKSVIYRGVAGENPDELYPHSLA